MASGVFILASTVGLTNTTHWLSDVVVDVITRMFKCGAQINTHLFACQQ